MTELQKSKLGAWLQKYAQQTNHPSLRLMEKSLLSILEEHSDAEDLGRKLAGFILDSHGIQIQHHQLSDYYAFWDRAVADIRS